MKKNSCLIWILLLIVTFVSTACSPQVAAITANDDLSQNADVDNNDHEDEVDDHEDSMGDHMDSGDDMSHAHVEVPAEFAGVDNPFADDHEAIEAGEITYSSLCVACHGENGDGDGPAAAGLTPAPAKLSDGAMMGMIGDDYLFWRISKGGTMEPFNSVMPAWESALTEGQRWQVVSYIRTFASEGDGHMDGDHMDNDHDN